MNRAVKTFNTGRCLNMNLVFKKFTEYFSDVYGNNDEKFIKVYDANFSGYT